MKVNYGSWTYDFSSMEMYQKDEPESGFRTFHKLWPYKADNFTLMHNQWGIQECPHEVQIAWKVFLEKKIEDTLLQ
jgi:hypothetical protein